MDRKTVAHVNSFLKLHFGGSLEEIMNDRTHQSVAAKRALIVLLRDYLKFSFVRVGKTLGYKDHTTVMHHYKKASEQYKKIVGDFVESLGVPLYNHNIPKGTRTRWSAVYKSRGFKCEVCSFDDVIEVHHIISKKAGGTDEHSNLILLCPNHHALIHAGLLYLNPKKFMHLILANPIVDTA